MTVPGAVLLLALALAGCASLGDPRIPAPHSAAEQRRLAPGEDWSPPWTKDLVVYVASTKTFTSPNGPESGTFASLAERFPYLQDLGVTGIWLIGHSTSDPTHFFNIWTQYAAIEPDQIDPSLGAPDEFKAMIAEAHRHDIKIFLEIISHGVMPESSLITKNPHWFRGGSWGMIDFDWKGGHLDLDDWWVQMWTDYVVRYGVDGFRIDLGMQDRPDLYARIRRNAEAAGHPIVMFEEIGFTIPGVTDFVQDELRISDPHHVGQVEQILAEDVPGFFARRFGRAGDYAIEIQYEDGSSQSTGTAAGDLRVRLMGLVPDKVSYAYNGGTAGEVAGALASGRAAGVRTADGIPDVHLKVENVADKPIANILVSANEPGQLEWAHWYRNWRLRGQDVALLAMEGAAPTIDVYVPTLTHGSSIQLSQHGNGWFYDGEESPYVAKGSRALFGYSFLFTPMIPIFMSGEEFDASFNPAPGLTVDLYGNSEPGKGRIVLGNMLDWSELDDPHHQAMLDDVRAMLRLRRQEPDLLLPEVRGAVEPRLTAVPFTSSISVPAPYMRWHGDEAVLVLANRDTGADARVVLNVPLERIGGTAADQYRVTDLWRAQPPRLVSGADLAALEVVVGRDKTPRGGLAVLKIERVQ